MLPNKVGFANIRVTCETLGLGMDVITQGDFSITNKDNKTMFSFRYPSILHVDYVKQGKRKAAQGIKKPGTNRGKGKNRGGRR